MIMKPDTTEKLKKGVYLIPNLFTTFGILAGFYAIIAATNDQFTHAAIAILVAMLLDGIDGRVARMTNTQTDFGAQYDSLADMVSFGLAPSLIIYEWSLHSMKMLGSEMGKIAWLAAFFFTAMAALRLARFNANIGKVDKKYFVGLPSPAAATVLVSFVWVCEDLGVNGIDMRVFTLFLTILAGALMISPIFYSSFKDNNREEKIPFRGALIIVLLLVLVIIDPPKVFFGVFFLYMMSGPVLATVRRIQKRKLRHNNDDISDNIGDLPK